MRFRIFNWSYLSIGGTLPPREAASGLNRRMKLGSRAKLILLLFIPSTLFVFFAVQIAKDYTLGFLRETQNEALAGMSSQVTHLIAIYNNEITYNMLEMEQTIKQEGGAGESLEQRHARRRRKSVPTSSGASSTSARTGPSRAIPQALRAITRRRKSSSCGSRRRRAAACSNGRTRSAPISAARAPTARRAW